MSKITAVITSYNEELKVNKALESLIWADEIIVVDGQSSDQTVKIARKYTNNIIITPNDPVMMSMRNKGIEAAQNDWILILDSDEIIPAELAHEIKKRIRNDKFYVAYRFPRRGYFLGKWIRHCGWYPDYQTRLFKKGHGYYKNEHVHEQAIISGGKTGTINIPFEHYSYYDFKEYLYKVHRYIKFETGRLVQRKTPPSPVDYLFFRPVARFLSIYICQKGILDSWRGLILSLFAGYHEFRSYFEYRKIIEKCRISNIQ